MGSQGRSYGKPILQFCLIKIEKNPKCFTRTVSHSRSWWLPLKSISDLPVRNAIDAKYIIQNGLCHKRHHTVSRLSGVLDIIYSAFRGDGVLVKTLEPLYDCRLTMLSKIAIFTFLITEHRQSHSRHRWGCLCMYIQDVQKTRLWPHRQAVCIN